MDNIRLFLWMGLGILIWITFQQWQADYAPAPAAVPENAATLNETVPAADMPTPIPDDLPSLPAAETPQLSSAPGQAPAGDPIEQRTIRVRTDVLDIQIGLQGGDLQFAELPDYPVSKDQPDVPVQLLSPNRGNLFVFGTGLSSDKGVPQPNHQSAFTSARDDYVLADGQDELVVTLDWQGADDLRAQKIYTFRRGQYAIDLNQVMSNDSQAPYRAVAYEQIKRVHQPPDRSMFDVDSYSFVGPVLYDGEKYEKLDAEDLTSEPLDLTIDNGWIASIQHHFLAAIVPEENGPKNYSARYDGTNTLLRAVDADVTTIPPGASASFNATLFVGPKLQSQLEEIGEKLTLTVDYGMLTLLAQPLFWLLQQVYDFVGNWGWTIVIVTLMIKLVFYKLTEKSGRSMAKMRKIAPRLKEIQERYKDNREELSRKMMDLYKREKVNPAAGCWPMLIQIPFFIAFYWVLLESVEMRQAPFMLWITDLSTRDPYFILPLLMGAAMFFQQKLNPPPPDPMQAKVMQFLPVMFTAMFAFFPAGLVLYWLTNSVLSIAQQWRINKVIGAD